MMEFKSSYVSHLPDEQGMIDYSDPENDVWRILYQRQMDILPGRACQEHIQGLSQLQLTYSHIPQLPEVNEIMQDITGWHVAPVQALISAREFFGLLAKRCFPAATFIRRIEELDYVQEPDIFHELFGHCPMLTNPIFADFVHAYAEFVLAQPEKDWPLLQRFFWFTIEFGLINTPAGLRAYGGGILSSIKETAYSVESDDSERKPFNALDIFRTPYRIDKLQPIYFVIDNYQQLYDFIQSDINASLQEAYRLGELPPVFDVDLENPNIHILAC